MNSDVRRSASPNLSNRGNSELCRSHHDFVLEETGNRKHK